MLLTFLHRVLPAIGPLALMVAIVLQFRNHRSALLLVSALSLIVTLAAAIASAWLGLRFDESHDLPEWFNQLYWWLTQWVAPGGYAIAGLSLLAFHLREQARRAAQKN